MSRLRFTSGSGEILVIAAANVRTRWSSFMGAFVAVCLGVAILEMTMLVWTSSAAKVPPRFAGTSLIAVGQTIPNENGTPSDLLPWSPAAATELVDKLTAVPGVDEAVIDRSFYAQVVRNGAPVPAGDEALTAGHGWSSAVLAPYELAAGSPPEQRDDVVVDQRLGFDVGDQVSLLFVSGPRTMTVTGLVDTEPSNGEPVPLERSVFVTDELASELAPGVSAIGLVLSPGANINDVQAEAQHQLDGAGTVLVGHDRSKLQPPYIAHDRFVGAQLLSAMTALGFFVTIFIVASTFASLMVRRRQELGLLRLVGALPSQVQRMVLIESAVTGTLGGIVGAGLGALGAPLLASIMRRIEVTAVDFNIEYTPGPILIPVFVGTIVATGGAWLSSRRAARTMPMEAMRSASVERSAMSRPRWIGGGLTLGAGIGVSILTATANADRRILLSLLGAMLFIVATTLLAPVLIPPFARLVTRPLRGARGAGSMLLRAELSTGGTRSAGLAASIIATVGFAVLISGYVPTSQVAYPAAVTAQLRGQSIVWPKNKPGLTDAEVNEVSTGPVVRAGLATRLFVDKPGQGITVMDGVGWLSPDDEGVDHAVVSTLLAEKFGWHEGQTLEVTFADGDTEELTIIAIRDFEPAMAGFYLSRNTVRAHDPTALTESIFVPSENSPTDLGPGAIVYDAESYALADYQRDYWLLLQFSLVLIVVAVGYTGIALANTMAMSLQGRHGFFRVLRMSGGSAGQIVTIVAAETFVIVCVGVLLGLAIALPSLAGIAAGLSETVGQHITPQIDMTTTMAAILACFTLALGTSATITWRSIKAMGDHG
ncbi:MAG: ABC transporter permease [Ancrocorticia sp.]